MFPDVKLHRIEKKMGDALYILFDQSEVISDSILNYGRWNDRTLIYAGLLLEELDDGDGGTVLDIGSGFGSFCVPVSLAFLNNYKFYAFEPQRPLFYQLCANLLANGIDNTFAKNEAISQENVVKDAPALNVNISANHGSCSLIDGLNSKREVLNESKESTTFKTIDDNYSFNNIKFIKITVCGMEYDVLLGAKNTIKNNDSPPLMVEIWNDEFHKETLEKTLSLLKELGYCSYFKKHNYYYFANEKHSKFLEFHTINSQEEETITHL